MWFNSFDFAVFFVIVLGLYWLFQRWRRHGLRVQNLMLLAASYFFYGYWDWRFLSLILISTVVDYVAGLRMQAAIDEGGPDKDRRKRRWVTASIVTNLGLLGFFKYFNFFAGSFEAAFGATGEWLRLDIVLPVGISFYTFQTMSYTIDIYRERMKPVRGLGGFLDFALFVAFFPQLVAGPIERASSLLPQIRAQRRFSLDQFGDGLHLIFWGLVKKVFVADNLAPYVDEIFAAGANPTGFAIIAGVWMFAFQIYCDFSGYSNIARGCAKCMGIDIRVNFKHPYISTNPREFWQRWHITLSTWLRDYLYIPLGGNRQGKAKTYRNLSITMLLGGLWHGAQWNFVFWGAYHGAVLMLHRALRPVLERVRVPLPGAARKAWHLVKMLFMFHVVCLGWLFFRAQDHSAGEIWELVRRAFTLHGAVDWSLARPLVIYAVPLLLVDLAQIAAGREELHRVRPVPAWAKCVAYSIFFYLFAFQGATAESFIYFQF